MAIDTASKRYSLIGLCSPVPQLMNVPSGSVDVFARQSLLFLYVGIEISIRHAFFGVLSIIEESGSGVLSAQTSVGHGIYSLIYNSFGSLSVDGSSGSGVQSQITSDGFGVNSEINSV